MTKFICVTGGVVSSLGKGIAAASLGAILEALRHLGADIRRDHVQIGSAASRERVLRSV